MASAYADSSSDDSSDDERRSPAAIINNKLIPGRETVPVDIRSLIPGKRYTFYNTPAVASGTRIYKFRATFHRIYNAPAGAGRPDEIMLDLKDVTEETQPDGSRASGSGALNKHVPIRHIDFVTDISLDTRVGRNIPKEIGPEIAKFLGGKKRRHTRKSKTQKGKKAGRRSRASVKRIKRSKH
jgi:hypothetical protein